MERTIPRLSASGYFHILVRIIAEPASFFSDLSECADLKKPLGFLVMSGIFFASAANIVQQFANPFAAAAVLFINALGMTFISAVLGYGLIIAVSGRRVSFRQVLSVYAYAAGTVFLVSWIPVMLWLAEPWKWWLYGVGLTRTFGLRWQHSFVIVMVSVGFLILFFWSLMPVIT